MFSVKSLKLRGRCKLTLVGMVLPSLLAGQWTAGASPVGGQTVIDEWLLLGPLPVSSSASRPDGNAGSMAGVELSFESKWPAAGDRMSWLAGDSYQWARQGTVDGALRLESDERPSVAFAAAYLEVDRWQKAKLKVTGAGARVIRVDGSKVNDDEELVLRQGKHWLLVETAPPEEATEKWEISARLDELTPGAGIEVSLDPRHPLSLLDLGKLRQVTETEMDPTGRRAAFLLRVEDRENDRRVSHVEVRELADGRLVEELRLTGQVYGPRWSRDGTRLAFATRTDVDDGDGRDLWMWRPGGGGSVRLLRNERGLQDIQWSADGDWIYFTATGGEREETGDSNRIERLTEVWHRWSYWRDRAHLFALNVDEGTRIELAGDPDYSIEGPTLSPDGQRMIFNRNLRFPERPFLRSELWIFDLGTRSSRKLLDLGKQSFNGPGTFAWAPDGSAVAFCGSAKELLEKEDPHFSVYEMELYATSIDQPQLKHLSPGFVPAVGAGLGCRQIHWSENDGRIYVSAGDGARTVLARTADRVPASLEGATLELLPLPAEVMEAYDARAGTLVAALETPVTPQVVYRIRVADGEASELFRPSAGALDQVAMPSWKEWNFTDSVGFEIEGWYWTPPDFDPTREYPLIVFYYGGTIAMKKSFQERLLWYAANGYIVYMLNPAGAPGYGQKFSDLHIDDWGYPAGSDIIEGVTKFVEAHPFVDGDRIGNFGRSYGGFMTMHLLTRTDLFAASVEVAGISNIAGYWGAGWTGYSYTDGTCPGCYPWNRRDVYVERSPLFQADRIRTPLLLIHGTRDTNVVPTESEQMFTALRGLGREAELVRFHGENHGINSKPSVQRTSDTIILEWFDKHLRDRPEAWKARWQTDDGVER